MSFLSKLFGSRSVDVAGATRLLADGAILVDVRSPREFTDGHAPAARNLPLDSLDRRTGTLSTGTPIVAICHTGVRSAQAARLLSAKGFQVSSVRGGMIAWKRAGERVVGGSR